MKAKVKINKDPCKDYIYSELEVGKEYEVRKVVIHAYSTDVYLENGNSYNSCIFDEKFKDRLYQVIDMFNSDEDSQVGDSIGVFIKDWY